MCFSICDADCIGYKVYVCLVLQVVLLNGVEDTDVISGDYVCWCAVLSTPEYVSMFSVMWLELLMVLEISVLYHH